MKFLAIASLTVAASAAVVENKFCNADNCLRAVRATRFGTATMVLRMAECSSYLAVTETPQPSTTFVTETSLETITLNATRTIFDRAVGTPASTTKNIPAYATACKNDAAYRSACSCFGATGVTTTAPIPIITSTISVVATTTVGPFVNATRPALGCSNPWTCGDKTIPTCSLDKAGEKGCVCFRTVEGRDVCAVPNDCQPSCNTTNDCSGGEVCIKQSCCLGGTCMKVDVCLNQILPKMMFKKRAGAGAWVKRQGKFDFSKLSLFPHDASLEQ
ncbi:hypothetical protein CGCSCA4_v005628 [Colletotrichum siamense]|uniref:Uncharacterized protein n=1 Tax=Colletotrichum siamense TaxID=690259 RepID=A0A9P5EUF5_COLSI|nr:hypothetical protein CGCSCA4_v005628 [Colletotrichum siamense]KAF4860238.1 hypothetical protein CGCSCA2_v005676 [Colletotrichum siamense]